MPHKEITGYPSVTQIIGILDKPFLRYWYGKWGTKYCEKKKRESQEIGSAFHEMVADILSQRIPRLPKKKKLSSVLQILRDGFTRWQNERQFQPRSIEPEEPVISKIHCYQGTYDAIGTFPKDNRKYIVDWKTSGQVDASYGLQLSAYAVAYGEVNGRSEREALSDISDGLAVRVDKATGLVEEVHFSDLAFYFDVFKSLLLPYQFVTQTGGWEKPEE